METKTCSITEDEIKALIMVIAGEIDETNIEASLDRLNYLNKRLKAPFKGAKDEAPEEPKDENKEEQKATASW